MDYIKTFESFNFSIENLSKLNEETLDAAFKESFKGINPFSIFSFFLEILALCSSDKSV